MKEPCWLDMETVQLVHLQLVGRFGGESGIRDPGLLESAMNRPRHAFQYEQPSLFVLASLYADGIANNHPFIDGNKRAGFVAAALFLELNGEVFKAPEAEAALFTLGLAAGKIKAEEYARWLEVSCRDG